MPAAGNAVGYTRALVQPASAINDQRAHSVYVTNTGRCAGHGGEGYGCQRGHRQGCSDVPHVHQGRGGRSPDPYMMCSLVRS